MSQTEGDVRILIADDDSAMCGLIQTSANIADISSVELSFTVDEALEKFGEADIITSDYDFGPNKKTGLDFIRHIRQVDPSKPIALISGTELTGHMLKELEELKVVRFKKPFEMDDFIDFLEEAKRSVLGNRLKNPIIDKKFTAA